jgi:hypothetical protein
MMREFLYPISPKFYLATIVASLTALASEVRSVAAKGPIDTAAVHSLAFESFKM